MDLSSMLDREDFFGLLSSTVEAYFKEAEHAEVTLARQEKHANLVIKPRLSALCPPKISKRAQAFFYSEWNTRGSKLKNLAVKAYVFAMLHTGRLFSSYRFRLEPGCIAGHDLVIAPNNRSIRFFDYKSGTVGCRIKDGFSDKFFKNQLQFRLHHQYDFLLPMERWGEKWFVEPILKGHPLARVTDDAMYRKGVADAFAAVRKLADDTVRRADARAYLRTLTERITALCLAAKEKKHVKMADDTLRLLERIGSIENLLPKELPVAMSHGDLQTGNVWVDPNGKTILYDWETAGERSVWYDSAVLAYALRRPHQWRQFLRSQAEKAYQADRTAKTDRAVPAVVKGVVMLEDILFYLEDMMELPQDWGGDIYDNYLKDLKNAVTEVGIA
ncbi:MAG: phosphotransferase [Oscillospiraceae bacterium]|nr:phosphotransferase [Oscillospiraceae bacterium]